LFGLSADPPTAAHVEMAHRLSQQDVDFHEIRIMPVYRHQFAVSGIMCFIIIHVHA
jgi:nicotinic acid mononucleotide adenylyltransferase